MTELANTESKEISKLDGLAMQAQALRMSISLNLWQLARVFIEAKELVPHGQFGKWVEENADVSERTAQDMMAAYKRFGGNPQFEGLGQAKTFKLLPLPEGCEEAFMATHDVAAMTTREIQEAVKQAREEARAAIEQERKARLEAERRAEEAEGREATIPPELTEELAAGRETIAQQRAEVEQLTAMGNEALTEQRRLARANEALQRELQERDDLLSEQQEALNRAQQELLNMQSTIAKGDAEREVDDQLSADAFTRAVRAFIGAVSVFPHMRARFAAMPISEKEEYEIALKTVEAWAKDSRRAIDTVDAEVIFHA